MLNKPFSSFLLQYQGRGIALEPPAYSVARAYKRVQGEILCISLSVCRRWCCHLSVGTEIFDVNESGGDCTDGGVSIQAVFAALNDTLLACDPTYTLKYQTGHVETLKNKSRESLLNPIIGPKQWR